ncbi:MAG: hypothetical protein HY675_16305 [Chloroflexi bacterium]|nr:hypothetical protein [Chloroflexota bacterium]
MKSNCVAWFVTCLPAASGPLISLLVSGLDKKTGQGVADKVIGEQLTVDIAKYGRHPDCKTLVCFVYDPENRTKSQGDRERSERDIE